MVTNLIIIISIIIFIIINFVDKSDDKISLAIKYGAFYMPRIEVKKEYWRFLTANFVHVDLIHIFMNIYCIYYLRFTWCCRFTCFRWWYSRSW